MMMIQTQADSDPESSGDRLSAPEAYISPVLKNFSQFTSLLAGLLLLTASGIEIGFTLFGITFDSQLWTKDASDTEVILVHSMFFIGSMVGGFNAGYFIDSLGRKNTTKISYGALTICSILLILAPQTVISILVARLFSGYSWGLLHVVMIVMAGEITLSKYRGQFTSLVYFFSFAGAVVFALVNTFNQFGDVNYICGWITLGLLLISIPCFYFFTIETPHYHCMKNNDSEGLQNLLYLRRERVITNARKEEFLGIQQSVARDMQHQAERSIFKNRLFYILLIIRIPVVFTSNQLINRSQLDIVTQGIAPESEYLFQPLLLTTVHLCASLIALTTIDRFKRIYYYAIPIEMCAIMVIISGIVLTVTDSFNPFLFIILFEIFSGLGIHMTGDILMTEAFSMRKKGIGISLLNFVLMVKHLIFILITYQVEPSNMTNYVVFFVHGALLIGFGFIKIADTKEKTLLEARQTIELRFFGLTF